MDMVIQGHWQCHSSFDSTKTTSSSLFKETVSNIYVWGKNKQRLLFIRSVLCDVYWLLRCWISPYYGDGLNVHATGALNNMACHRCYTDGDAMT